MAFSRCRLLVPDPFSPAQTNTNAQVLGGRGRIALDRTVHKRPNSNSPTNPEPWGDWNMMVSAGVDLISVQSEQALALYDSWGPEYHPIVGKFVQNGNNMLRLLGDNGHLVNGLQVEGTGASAYLFWWDMVHYAPSNAEFRVVPL